ncbi:hypothetical protein U8527_17760 [Kordia algicida OT-1]|uniref:Uncharacterized protein n=1 Tax=Kordia algicida OT-1 TaxID=391587 RepID=A9DI44_9FLAO|nr:hypothetical protein [Kordia algicida]EDP97836.1 hypothetical protein KAOT1_11502 [Kordia algicida OT-1]
MKKQFKSLKLNKQLITNFSYTITGGGEISEKRTNCDYCPKEPQKPIEETYPTDIHCQSHAPECYD